MSARVSSGRLCRDCWNTCTICGTTNTREAGNDAHRDQGDQDRIEQREGGFLLQRLARVQIIGKMLQYRGQRTGFLAAVHQRAVEIGKTPVVAAQGAGKGKPGGDFGFDAASTSRVIGAEASSISALRHCSMVSPDASKVAICLVTRLSSSEEMPRAHGWRARSRARTRLIAEGSRPWRAAASAPGAAYRLAPPPILCARPRPAPRSGMLPSIRASREPPLQG